MTSLRSITDGIVTIRTPRSGDTAILISGRDDEFHRFLGEGSDDPRPFAVIEVDGAVVGWVDHDAERDWLLPGEVNIGYNVFAPHRGNGFATRAVQLLLHHLAITGDATVATLLIDSANDRSLALARRIGAVRQSDLDGHPYFKRSVPPLVYTDGVVTIRRRAERDLDADLQSKDDEQIDWLWRTGERASWAAMTAEQQRVHALAHLRSTIDRFGTGPRWTFSVDAAGPTGVIEAVAVIDCDLANEHVPRGAANIAYAAHPSHRGNGWTTRGVRLVQQFIREHTGCRETYLVIDERNVTSLRVARSLAAMPDTRWTDDLGRTFVRHKVPDVPISLPE